MQKTSNIKRYYYSFTAIFKACVSINYRRYLLHREIIVLLLLLLVQFTHLSFIIPSQKQVDSIEINNILAATNIIILIFVSRSSVIDFADHKNRYLYFQKAYGINIFVYLIVWLTYSLITGLIKIGIVVALTIAYLQYWQFKYPKQFAVSYQYICLAIGLSFFSFYSATLFFNAILPHNYLGIRLITATLFIGIITSISLGLANQLGISSDHMTSNIEINPSEWFISVISIGNPFFPIYSYEFYRNVLVCQAVIPIVISFIIEAIKIHRFQIVCWFSYLFDKGKPSSFRTLLENTQIIYDNRKRLFSISQLIKKVGKTKILKDISMDIYSGETILLSGVNGSGKSTLLRIIGSIETITQGTLKRTNNLRIGICLQTNYMYEEFTVKENLEFYSKINGISDIDRKIDYLMESFELNEIAGKHVYKLSGGNKKKLSLALSFLGENDLIVIEQPTFGVDLVIKKQIWRILNRQRVSNPSVTMIIASSDPEIQLLSMASRIIVLRKGQILADCPQISLNQEGTYLVVEIRKSDCPNLTFLEQLEQFEKLKMIYPRIYDTGNSIYYLKLKNWTVFEACLQKHGMIKCISMVRTFQEKDKFEMFIYKISPNCENDIDNKIQSYFTLLKGIKTQRSFWRMVWACVMIRHSEIMPNLIDVFAYIFSIAGFWVAIALAYNKDQSIVWKYSFYLLFPVYFWYLYPHAYYSHVVSKQCRFSDVMRIHGLKRLNYWLISMFIDTLLIYFQFIILWFLTYIVDYTSNPLYLNNMIFIYMLQYLIVATIFVKILSTWSSLAFNSMVFIPFVVGIIQNIIIPLTFSPAKSNRIFIVFNLTSPIFSYFTNTFSTTTNQQSIQNWQKLLYFLSQLTLYSSILWCIPALQFAYGRRQKTLKLSQVSMINSCDKIKEKLRVVDKQQSNIKRDAITIDNLYLQFSSKHTIIKEMYLGIQQGTIFGLLGRNGSGKSTTLQLMASLINRTTGNIYFRDQEITSLSSPIYEQIGYCPQFDYLLPYMTVQRHLKIVMTFKNIPINQQKELSLAVLSIFEMKDSLQMKVVNLSLGEKTKLKIITALMCNPQAKYVLLDEPSIGLDQASQSTFWKLVLRLSKDLGVTFIYVTHKTTQVQHYCNRVGILQRGEFISIGSPKQLSDEFCRGYSITIKVKDTTQLKRKYASCVQQQFKVFEWREIEEGTIKVSVPHLYFSMTAVSRLLKELLTFQGCSFFCLKEEGFEEVFDYLSWRKVDEGNERRSTELKQLNAH